VTAAPVLFDFTRGDAAAEFRAIDDAVMGGVSDSRLVAEPGRAVFTGVVSLERGGGFASVRSEPRDFDLSGWSGIQLVVRGDGRRYKLNLRTDDDFDGITWQASFETAPGAWIRVEVPFSTFEPRFHGDRVDSPPLDPARIRTVGFLISDRQVGPFRLEIQRVEARVPTSPAPRPARRVPLE
jgi:hypothetical protein